MTSSSSPSRRLPLPPAITSVRGEPGGAASAASTTASATSSTGLISAYPAGSPTTTAASPETSAWSSV